MSKKIIIVEDDPFSQDFYKFIFSKAGYEPVIIEEGDKLLEILRNEDIKLVIMDINLKNTYLKGEKTDGMKLSRVIKQDKQIAKIPILLITAYTASNIGKNFFEESLAEDFITKPILDFNLLINKVTKLIQPNGH
jgi:two-component system, cell cycle response regulator DivK